MFAPGGRVVLFSFRILVNPLFILFLFLGLVLYLLAAQPQIMDAVFVGHEEHAAPVRGRRLPGPGAGQPGPDHPGRLRPGQDRRRQRRLGTIIRAWASFSTGGLVVALLLNLVLLLVPLCGWVLLQKLLGKATPKWDKPAAAALALAGRPAPDPHRPGRPGPAGDILPALVRHHGHLLLHLHPGQFPGRQPEPGRRRHRQAGRVVLFLSLPLFPQDRPLRQEGPGGDRERERRHRLFLLLSSRASSASPSWFSGCCWPSIPS